MIKLPIVPQDKAWHFLGGQLVALAGLPFGLWTSVVIVLFMAVGKEVYDQEHPQTHSCEVLDAVATLSGGIPIWLVAWLSR